MQPPAVTPKAPQTQHEWSFCIATPPLDLNAEGSGSIIDDDELEQNDVALLVSLRDGNEVIEWEPDLDEVATKVGHAS